MSTSRDLGCECPKVDDYRNRPYAGTVSKYESFLPFYSLPFKVDIPHASWYSCIKLISFRLVSLVYFISFSSRLSLLAFSHSRLSLLSLSFSLSSYTLYIQELPGRVFSITPRSTQVSKAKVHNKATPFRQAPKGKACKTVVHDGNSHSHTKQSPVHHSSAVVVWVGRSNFGICYYIYFPRPSKSSGYGQLKTTRLLGGNMKGTVF